MSDEKIELEVSENFVGGRFVTISVGTTTTGEPGTKASVTNSGTSSAAVLNFTIPAGAKGEKGDPGAAGTDGADGKTPARGTDYWTEEDVNKIKAYCENAILNGEW